MSDHGTDPVVDDAHLFAYDATAKASVAAMQPIGDLLVTEVRDPPFGGDSTHLTLIQPRERTPAAGLVIAHGGTDVGRHIFRREAQRLAQTRATGDLPAAPR